MVGRRGKREKLDREGNEVALKTQLLISTS
jgi:hypothetical protein